MIADASPWSACWRAAVHRYAVAMDHARHALVFGASGQIGTPLLARLRAHGWRVSALSRSPRHDAEGVRWLRGSLDAMPPLPEGADAIFSCGPLDHFARWYAATPLQAPRVVAFGSTSIATKQASADAAERDVAERLRSAEATVFDAAARRGAAAIVLRPTLVYGAGRDRTLTRIAALARRRGVFVLPTRAGGLRQPVHVDDLADAALAACNAAAAAGRAYDLPGGECLAYDAMVARVLACLRPPVRLLRVPMPLFRGLLALARLRGGGIGAAALARMQHDLVFDAAAARRDFGYAPRAFVPDAGMFAAG